jgi:ABC-type bacteriocin/lantibiotic exporter with double-glycine peptidase domain
MKSNIQRLFRILRPYQKEIKQLYLTALGIGLLQLTLPLGFQAIINFVQSGSVSASWVVMVMVVLGGITLVGIMQRIQFKTVEIIQQDLFTRTAGRFAATLPKIELSPKHESQLPSYANRFFEIVTLQKGIPTLLVDFMVSSFQLIFGILLLTLYSPLYIGIGAALLIVLTLLVKFLSPQGLSTSLEESKYKYAMLDWLQEVTKVNPTFKLRDSHVFHLHQSDQLMQGYLRARERHFNVLLRQFNFLIVFKVLVAFSLLFLGSLMVFENNMNLGQLVAAEILILMIMTSLEKIWKGLDAMYDVFTAIEKQSQVLDLKQDQESTVPSLESDLKIDLDLQDLSYRFPESVSPVFSHLSLSIPFGQWVHITGNSDIGKTTLLKLISGIYPQQTGHIHWKGLSKLNPTVSELQHVIGIHLGHPLLFQGSILDNILVGRSPDPSHFQRVMSTMGLEEELDNLAEGIHTPILSGGSPLSPAQKDLILFARMWIGQPKVAFLDHPLEFISAEKRKLIISRFAQEERTVLVNSERIEWKNNCTQDLEI